MSYYKQAYARKQWITTLAEEAKSIFSSETATPEEKEYFVACNPWYAEAGVEGEWSDHLRETDLMALVVLDDVPNEMIDEALRLSAEEEYDSYLWLADAYDTLPDYNPENPGAVGTLVPIDSGWRSPFVGSSVETVAAFIRAAPKPPKPLCKTFFAVLRKEQFEKNKQLTVYKILDVEGATDGTFKLQSVPCPAHLVGHFFTAFDRYPTSWEQAVENQRLFWGVGDQWEDDCGEGIDLFALILLDDFPIETINHTLQDNNSEDLGIWLADAYENLPDVRPTHRLEGTSCPIDSSWRSPFAGKSIEDAANFVRNAPKPPKPLNKTWFAVMQKDRFEKSGELLVCKILPIGGELDLSENGKAGTESFRSSGMSLMCKVHSDKQQKISEGNVRGEHGREVEAQMQRMGVSDLGEDEGEFEVQMRSMGVGDLGTWVGQDDAKYWWLG